MPLMTGTVRCHAEPTYHYNFTQVPIGPTGHTSICPSRPLEMCCHRTPRVLDSMPTLTSWAVHTKRLERILPKGEGFPRLLLHTECSISSEPVLRVLPGCSGKRPHIWLTTEVLRSGHCHSTCMNATPLPPLVIVIFRSHSLIDAQNAHRVSASNPTRRCTTI